MARPGIMLYFELRKPLAWLSDAQKGKLFDAILEYGEYGVAPEFDGMLAMAWGFIQPRLDKDCESYENSKAQRQYANFCKKRNSRGLPKVSFDEWLEMDETERNARCTSDNGAQRPVIFGERSEPTGTGPYASGAFRNPSTSTSTSTSTSSSTSTSTSSSTSKSTSAAADTSTDEPDGADAPDAAAAAERHRLEFIHGELGQGLVKLTPFQFDMLLDELGVEMFDHYVKKLADWIRKNGATPGNHYNTIRKWYHQDSGTEV